MFVRSLAQACIALGCAASAWAADCLAYEPDEVRLTSIVSMSHGFGPPGFGEDPAHDSEEDYVLLTLDKPICVAAGHVVMDEDVAATDAFQLVPKSGSLFDRRLLGKRISVSGTLFHRVSGGHTEVMILYADAGKGQR